MIVLAIVLAGNISLHDCTIVNTDLPNIVVDVGYSYFLNLKRYTLIIDSDSYKKLITYKNRSVTLFSISHALLSN